MNENEELLAGIQRAHDELDAIVSAWNRVTLKAMDAATNERAKIVAWLRAQNTTANLELEDDLAKEIEAGEHLK